MLVLNRSDFMKIVAESPALLGEMRRSVRERFATAQEMTEDQLVENLKS